MIHRDKSSVGIPEFQIPVGVIISKYGVKKAKIFGFLLAYSYLFASQEGTHVRKSQIYLAFCSLIRTFARRYAQAAHDMYFGDAVASVLLGNEIRGRGAAAVG